MEIGGYPLECSIVASLRAVVEGVGTIIIAGEGVVEAI